MKPLNDFPLHEEVGYREKSSKAMSGAVSILFGTILSVIALILLICFLFEAPDLESVLYFFFFGTLGLYLLVNGIKDYRSNKTLCYILNPSGIHLEQYGKLKQTIPWADLSSIQIKLDSGEDYDTYILKFEYANHTLPDCWTRGSYGALFEFWKICLACHPELVQKLPEPEIPKKDFFGNPKKTLQHRFFEDSYDYINSAEYTPFEMLKF